MQRIYFDNAATTPLLPEVLEAMLPFLKDKFGNPSSIYSYGREAKMAIEAARKSVAKLLNAQPSEIFFTSGGTESTNTAIQCAVRDLQCTHIITSPIEHHATLHTVEFLEKIGAVTCAYVNLTENGHVDLMHLEELLNTSSAKTLVTLMHANNEVGNILDINACAEICKKHNAIFHSDTVQTLAHYQFNLSTLNMHFINGAGHKFHGPKGTGLLYISNQIQINPLLKGGSQERNMRAGTENVAGIVGFATAYEIALKNLQHETTLLLSLKNYFKEQIKMRIPTIQFNGDVSDNSLCTVLNVAFPVTDRTEMLMMNLDIAGICVSGGSACSSGAASISHVIKNIYPNENRLPIRFSFSKMNTTAEIDTVIAKIIELI